MKRLLCKRTKDKLNPAMWEELVKANALIHKKRRESERKKHYRSFDQTGVHRREKKITGKKRRPSTPTKSREQRLGTRPNNKKIVLDQYMRAPTGIRLMKRNQYQTIKANLSKICNQAIQNE